MRLKLMPNRRAALFVEDPEPRTFCGYQMGHMTIFQLHAFRPLRAWMNYQAQRARVLAVQDHPDAHAVGHPDLNGAPAVNGRLVVRVLASGFGSNQPSRLFFSHSRNLPPWMRVGYQTVTWIGMHGSKHTHMSVLLQAVFQ